MCTYFIKCIQHPGFINESHGNYKVFVLNVIIGLLILAYFSIISINERKMSLLIFVVLKTFSIFSTTPIFILNFGGEV